MKLLSVVVPCYNEEDNVTYFYDEFIKNESFLKEHELDFEIIYIDDGSKTKRFQKSKSYTRMITVSNWFHFPETLEKKQVSMQALKKQRAIML